MQFQLTHSRGVRLSPSLPESPDLGFQLTHSRGVRPEHEQTNAVDSKISTHTLTWSTTSAALKLFVASAFQLTHSRGVRPLLQSPLL